MFADLVVEGVKTNKDGLASSMRAEISFLWSLASSAPCARLFWWAKLACSGRISKVARVLPPPSHVVAMELPYSLLPVRV